MLTCLHAYKILERRGSMEENLSGLINEIRTSDVFNYIDEAATKQGIVLRVLKILGWSPYNINEVIPEYCLGGGRVDYALQYKGIIRAFIEVKRSEEKLERHQDQLLNYSFKQGVMLAVLTNGISWWFYLPLSEGSWENRMVYSVNLQEQSIEEVISKLEMLLSKEN